MLDRREFHSILLGSLLAATPLGRGQAASRPDASARLVLNRLTHGATPQGIDRFTAMGLKAWISEELAKPESDPALDDILDKAVLHIEYEAGETSKGAPWQALSENRPLDRRHGDPKDQLKYLDFGQGFAWEERIRGAREIIAISLLRARHADYQLREVMTQFWHEHFSVNALTDEYTAIFFAPYDAALRAHALGNFRTLLGAVATSPAMLIYLNNDASRASPANENYARELLELHTLGAEHYHNDLYDDWKAVPGAQDGLAQGYIDQDVYEVARAFTGWTVGDGRWIDDGEYAPKTGRYEYVETWHDPYQKRILGREFAPNRAAMADGQEVLDMLAAHPGTARFVTRKMLRRLGIETPSQAYHARIAGVFQDNWQADDQIAKTVQAIVLDPEFLATPATKLRRPFEYLVALYRASGSDVYITDTPVFWYLQKMGWTQHRVRPPTGHSDDTSAWANTRALKGLTDMAIYAHDDWMRTARWNAAGAHSDNVETWGDLARFWAARFGTDPAALVQGLSHVEAAPLDALTSDPDHLAWANRTLISLAAVSPEFLFR